MEAVVKKEEIYFLFNFPAWNPRTSEGSNQRPSGGKTKMDLFILTYHSSRVTRREAKVGGSWSQVSCPFCLTTPPASGGILVQVGLSLYIPAPSCHAGDYVKAWRSGGWCSLLPFACCQWKVSWEDWAGRQRHRGAILQWGYNTADVFGQNPVNMHMKLHMISFFLLHHGFLFVKKKKPLRVISAQRGRVKLRTEIY